MKTPELTALDKTILGEIQSGFPTTAEPYAQLAQKTGASVQEVLERIRSLRASGVIRRIGGSFAAGPLGYLSTLVGCRVAPAAIETAAAVAGAFPGVTHNYEREGDWNLWFTVIAPSAGHLDHILRSVRAVPGVQAVHNLPCIRLFKIRVQFQFGGKGAETETADAEVPVLSGKTPEAIPLDAMDRRVIRRLCGDIGDTATPYAALAAELGLDREDLLARIQRYRATGAMRRLGAVLRHRAAGIAGNGMSVWDVPPEDIERVGLYLAQRPEISHCYERPRIPDWPYNLFGMVHGTDRDQCRRTAKDVSEAVGIVDYQLLFTVREFKKSSMVYFAD